MIELSAGDGHKLSAYRAEPKGKPRGGLIVVQEIFGVNSHIRGIADGYAADGYLAVAPAIFDRTARGLNPGTSQSTIAVYASQKKVEERRHDGEIDRKSTRLNSSQSQNSYAVFFLEK